MMSNYISKNRCKYSIKMHLIFVCKYRKKLLSKAISDNIKQIIFEVSKNSSFSIDIIETDQDHIHILLNITPQFAISSIVNRLKSISTYRIWKLELVRKLSNRSNPTKK